MWCDVVPADAALWLWQWWLRGYTASKVHEPNMGPIRGRQDPGGPHVGPHELCYLGKFVLAGVSCISWFLLLSITRLRHLKSPTAPQDIMRHCECWKNRLSWHSNQWSNDPQGLCQRADRIYTIRDSLIHWNRGPFAYPDSFIDKSPSPGWKGCHFKTQFKTNFVIEWPTIY